MISMGQGSEYVLDSLYIAWQYVRWNRGKTIILITSITLIAFLPLALQVMLNESEQQLRSRAVDTPLLIGAKGSALDLVMSSLYFDDEVPETINMQAVRKIDDSGLAQAIPLYVRFQARGFPVVGTALDYLDFRDLKIEQGRMFTVLGEAVIGADVAERLQLGPGDSLVSSPDNLFDIAGIYPLKMKVTGVLARSHSPDDLAVFVDTKTAWVIQGLGHGHKDVTKTTDSSVILKKEDGNVTANAKLMQYNEITDDNIDSFHLHGDPATFPITALLALPYDSKSGTILQGRYLDKDSNYQIVEPAKVIDSLLANIFKIRSVLDAVILLVGSATILALVLVFSLSLRLRAKEMETIFKLGSSRATTARLLGAEIMIIAFISALICLAIMLLLNNFDEELVRRLFI